MPIFCKDIPNTKDVKKALYANIPSMVHLYYIGQSKIPGIDATQLSPCVMPVIYKEFANEIETLKVYDDDVWVTSFPRSGTTWTQEMVWLIVNNLDFDGAKKNPLSIRYTFLELSGIYPDKKMINGKTSVQVTKEMPRPRFIKSHHSIAILPTDFWSVKPKLVYVTRNPKDTAISFYHHFVNLHHYKGSLEDFLDIFLKDLAMWSPFSDHVLNYWKLRNEPNILFIQYEDMSKDLKKVLQTVAEFFGKTYTDEQFNCLAKHLSFDEMKKNDSVNYEAELTRREHMLGEKRVDSNYRFIRRGQVNSAKDEMPVEYQKQFDDFLAKKFKGSDFKFNV